MVLIEIVLTIRHGGLKIELLQLYNLRTTNHMLTALFKCGGRFSNPFDEIISDSRRQWQHG